MKNPKLSIVTTLYKSAPYVQEFYDRITSEAKKITKEYEIIFVDDGSPDESLGLAIALHKKDKKVKVIELSRNFGHHKAIMTGLAHSKGDYIFLIDSDLEEEPELLGRFWAEMNKDLNTDVVYGVQENRKGNWFEKWSGDLFYRILNMLTDIKIPVNFLTVRLMKRKYVIGLVQYAERSINFSTLTVLCGFNQREIKVNKKHKGKSSYNLYRKLFIVTEAVTSSSAKPLWMIFYTGFSLVIGVGIYISYIVIQYMLLGSLASGWSSIVVSIWMFGGLQLLALGIISIYLSRIFEEVKQRPRVLIKGVYE